LWLDRFALYEQTGTSWELTQQAKRREGAPLDLRVIKPLLEAWIARWQAMLTHYTQQGFRAEQFTVAPDWRLIVGLGATHVLETSVTLHRVYGFPFIPGSGLKGMTRAYVELVLGKSEEDDDFRCIFGSQQKGREQAGDVIFFDAIPTQVPRLKLDVMNPHYSEYYRGGSTPPADWLSPVPVYFLTVERTPFLFALAARQKEANGLVVTVSAWLKAALSELGVGAKTATGYGYFGGS
jgi:CRISPR-associated protein Cmr6